MFNEWFFVGMAISCLLVSFGHYFDWPSGLGRILSYVYGTASILAGVGIWLCIGLDLWELWAGIAAIALATGVIVVGWYGYDNWRRVQKIESVDHDLKP